MHVPTHLVAAMSRLIRMLCIAGTAALATPGAMAKDDSSPAGVVEYRPTVLITGSNRGIGYEFARQYAERGWFVIATSRSPEDDFELKELDEAFDNLIIEQLDVTDHARIDVLAAQ